MNRLRHITSSFLFTLICALSLPSCATNQGYFDESAEGKGAQAFLIGFGPPGLAVAGAITAVGSVFYIGRIAIQLYRYNRSTSIPAEIRGGFESKEAATREAYAATRSDYEAYAMHLSKLLVNKRNRNKPWNIVYIAHFIDAEHVHIIIGKAANYGDCIIQIGELALDGECFDKGIPDTLDYVTGNADGACYCKPTFQKDAK